MSKPVNQCPRCDGPLLGASDFFGTYRTCLMCGYVREDEQLNAEVARAEARETRRLPARKVRVPNAV